MADRWGTTPNGGMTWLGNDGRPADDGLIARATLGRYRGHKCWCCKKYLSAAERHAGQLAHEVCAAYDFHVLMGRLPPRGDYGYNEALEAFADCYSRQAS
jgi:hypothetical protein